MWQLPGDSQAAGRPCHAAGQSQSKTPSLGCTISRNVMVVGCSGKGKTTIVNMLINNGIEKEDLGKPGRVSGEAGGATKRSWFYPVPHRSLLLCDTAGIGAENMSDDQLMEELKTTFHLQALGLDRIVVVSRLPRWTQGERKNLDLLDEVFGMGWAKQATFVLTDYCGKLEDSASALETWYASDPEAKEVVSRFQQVILTQNGVKREKAMIGRPLRENCLAQLNKSIYSPSPRDAASRVEVRAPALVPKHEKKVEKEWSTTREWVLKPEPEGFWENLVALFKKFRFWKEDEKYELKEEVACKDVIKKVTTLVSRKKKTLFFAARCDGCEHRIEFGDLKMTECRHSFHRSCWERNASDYVPGSAYTCPYPKCGRLVSVIYDV